MAIKTYRALQRGQAPNGAIVEEGQLFAAEFREIVYEGEGKARKAVIEDGKVKTRVAKSGPSWAEEVEPEKGKTGDAKAS